MRILLIITTLFIMALTTTPAFASRTDTMEESGKYLIPGERARAPRGFGSFCHRHPIHCSERRGAGQHATPEQMSVLETVNRAVNREIRQLRDEQIYGRIEFWNLPTREGDCEDIALEKMVRLVEKGIPASSMRIAIVRMWNGEGHAVLVVRTAEGDMVLDNLEPRMQHWTDTDYEWLIVQDGTTPRKWHRLQTVVR